MGKYLFLIETLNKHLQQPAPALDATEGGMLITENHDCALHYTRCF